VRDEIVEGRPMDDFDEFVNSSRRRNESETAILGSVCKLATPTLDKGTD